MKNLFSLRRKILLLLLATSFLSGIAFLILSISTFKNDKVAYIFETNNTLVNGMADQVNTDIRRASASAKNHLLKIDAQAGFENLVLADEDPLEGLEIFKISQTQEVLPFTAAKKKNFSSNLSASELAQIQNKLSQKEKHIDVHGDYVFIAEKIKLNPEDGFVVLAFKSDAMGRFLTEEKSFSGFIVNQAGDITHSDKSLSDTYVKDQIQPLFKKNNLSEASTSQLETSDKKTWLMTIVPTGYDDFYLVSMVDEAKAMSAVKRLVVKAVIIFAIIFIIIIMIGIVSSAFLTSRLSALSEATKKVIRGDYQTLVSPQGADEITELTTNFNQMTAEIVRLLSETAHKARMASELKTAQAVQEALFPKPECDFEHLHIRGKYISASECGGDWWYYSENEDKIWLWIADATGHGAPAALLTSAARSAVAIIENMALEPMETVKLLNKAICGVSKENMMMTCFMGIFDKKTKTMHYVNASHEPPILVKPAEKISKGDLIYLNDVTSERLGQSVDSEFEVSSVQLESGDRILFYTDGIPDIRNLEETSLGERGFIRTIVSSFNATKELNDLAEHFHKSLSDYRQETELVDDVTYCFIEIK